MSAVVTPARGDWMPGQQAHRTQVDVLVETAADLEEQLAQGDVVRHERPADRPEQQGVVGAQDVEPVGRHHLA